MRLQDSTQNEPAKRVIINELLKESDWILIDSNNIKKNVEYEVSNKSGSADYVLYDDDRYPLCIIEAKANEPLDGKEQARAYSKSLNCRFVILSNGHQHYFWDTELGNPQVIDKLPSQIELINLKNNFNPKKELFKDDIIENDYVALTQFLLYRL